MEEARASLNFKVKTGKGYDVMITLRDDDEGALLTRFKNIVTTLENAQAHIEGHTPPPVHAVKTEETMPVATSLPWEPEEGELAFYVTRIEPGMYNGGPMWKVKGGKFQKFGIPLYEQGLKASGIDPNDYSKALLEPDPGIKATYEIYVGKDGKDHYRVIKLEMIP